MSPESHWRYCRIDGQQDPAEEDESVLVVAGGDTAPLLQPPESAFDGVPLGVAGWVEAGWASAFGSPDWRGIRAGQSVLGWCGDPSAAQLAAGRGVGVGLVGQAAGPGADGRRWVAAGPSR